ncbi:uncharacterized protein [Pyxicephalus adspersus]|uniref:uncharacterized protein n=1 Tax=Pyxicephalus adspersus TaxID=30357 RepID=UPI003B5A003A
MAGTSSISILLVWASLLWSIRSDPDASIMEKGKSQLLTLHNFAQHPNYGDCWRKALQRVDVGCKQLNEEEQSRIALAFTHCHLERSGRDYPACSEYSAVRQCTHGMDSVAFNTYTEFFTHAHSICYYLQNELWQERAQDIILRLTVNSDSVARQLEATNIMAEEMMQAQNATLQSQEEILRTGHLLKQTLHESTTGMKQAFEEMQQSANEQRLLYSEIFNRITYLHQFVVGESNTLYSFLYNLMGCAAAFLLTSTKRTANARLALFILVAANVYLERLICSYIMGNTQPSYDQTENIAFWVGIARKISISLGLLILIFFSVTYRDVQQQTMEVLQEMKETKAELQNIIQGAKKLLNQPGSFSDNTFMNGSLFGDSGISEIAIINVPPVKGDVQLENQLISSTPKRRARSQSGGRKRVRAVEPAVHNVQVVHPVTTRYNLRSSLSMNANSSAL